MGIWKGISRNRIMCSLSLSLSCHLKSFPYFPFGNKNHQAHHTKRILTWQQTTNILFENQLLPRTEYWWQLTSTFQIGLLSYSLCCILYAQCSSNAFRKKYSIVLQIYSQTEFVIWRWLTPLSIDGGIPMNDEWTDHLPFYITAHSNEQPKIDRKTKWLVRICFSICHSLESTVKEGEKETASNKDWLKCEYLILF